MNIRVLIFFTIVFNFILSYSNSVLAIEGIDNIDRTLDPLLSLSADTNRYKNVFIIASGDVRHLSSTIDENINQDNYVQKSNDINIDDGEKNIINSPLRETTTEISSYPDWFLNPNIAGYFATAVGSSKYNYERGLSYQKRMARIEAAAELSKIISVEIDNQIERSSVHSEGNEIKYDMNVKSRHKSNSRLENVEQLEEWLDPVTNDYYILLGIKYKPTLD